MQNSVTVARNATESAGSCGTGAQAVALLLTTDAGGASSVSYYRGTGTDQKSLYRRTCAGGAVTGSQRVISNLALAPPAPLQTMTFTCAPTTDCQNWQLVTASVTQSDAGGRNLYPTTVQATRRIS